MKIGAQLFTVRDLCKDEGQTAEILKKIAEMGYPGIQVSGIGSFNAQWMKDTCDSLGLEIVITHTPATRLQEELPAVIAEHHLMGARFIGLGAMARHYHESGKVEDYRQFVETYRPIAREIAKEGLLFMYHNHGFEWQVMEGKLLIDRLTEDFAPEEMGITLDTYWVQAGGGDPAAWLEKLSGRIPCIHFKDMAHTFEKPIMAPVMRGNLNWERIIPAAEKAGVEWAFVEQDNCYDENPLDCLEESFQNLRTFLTKR